ncbi:TPA: NAD(P)H-binding protein [Stenotrophomonas maltophilia]|nr:NAD(P)H-binding protein [Stenotrophomonas maltophilia]HDS1024726.1 NAD(P)H-binding protein [Stenotrophomonas maltophilia]HDS1030798.1 NAD(P)H-binding protein [Stenotrophomonas maltophilia]HDS1033459.1 NAD(P)H-binding protein [Stenotrophomonas maltophilia]
MKIALVGATGNIGRQIARHALAHGHQVTAVVRSEKDLPAELAGAQLAIAALDDSDALAAVIAGHDVLASAYGPRPGDDIGRVAEVAGHLLDAARQAKVARVVVVGGAGSLEVAPGVQLVDTPDFPAAYKPYALAHREAFKRLQAVDDLDWTFFSPAAEIGPGEERGQYRVQAKAFLADAQGHSRISYADYGAAFVAELEAGKYPKQIITAAY